jgi:NADPH2:quinone reductase
MILYTKVEFDTEVRRLMNGKGVDVIYDSVGKTTFEQGLNCLRPRGYMVLCGQSSGPVPPLNPQVLNAKGSLFLTRPTLRDYVADRTELLGRASELFKWMGEGTLDVRIDKTFPLSRAGAAMEYLANRQSKGKILLIPGS